MIGALGYTCNLKIWRALAAAHKNNIYSIKIVFFQPLSSLLFRTCTGTKINRHIAFKFDLELIERCLENEKNALAAPIEYRVLLDIYLTENVFPYLLFDKSFCFQLAFRELSEFKHC